MIPFSGERRMWTIESMIADKENTVWVIKSAAITIVAQLGKNSLIGR